MKRARMMARKPVGMHLYAHTDPGTPKIRAIECMLCHDIIYEPGPGPYVASGLVKAIRLHFFLAHDIDATDIPERR